MDRSVFTGTFRGGPCVKDALIKSAKIRGSEECAGKE